MRHAKSSWDDRSLSDYDRPLNQRGFRDAPRMARWLDQQQAIPDLILSSTAMRAITTAKIVVKESGFTGELFEYRQLYLGVPNDYLGLLAELSQETQLAMVVGHNHGLEDLVERLTGDYTRMPTAAIAKIDLMIDDWEEVPNVTGGQLLAIWRPKEIDVE